MHCTSLVYLSLRLPDFLSYTSISSKTESDAENSDLFAVASNLCGDVEASKLKVRVKTQTQNAPRVAGSSREIAGRADSGSCPSFRRGR